MTDPVKTTGGKKLDLPNSFCLTYKGVTFDDVPRGRGHNEGHVKVTCESGTFFDDSYTVAGQRTTNGYLLSLGFNSWSLVPFWNEGALIMAYNRKNETWTMSASVDGKEWTFCDPKAVIDVIKRGLDCYQGKEGKTAVELKIFLEQNVDKIIQNAALYTRAGDCQMGEEEYAPNIGDAPVIMWD